MEETKTKLNLASGLDYREGYINIDDGSMINARRDMTADLFTFNWTGEKVDEILLSHFAMYIHVSVMPTLLKRWSSWLEKDGILIIETGDLKKIAQTILNSDDPKIINGTNAVMQLFGWSNTADHVWAWCADTLKPLLEDAGFEVIEITDGGLHNRSERDFTIKARKL